MNSAATFLTAALVVVACSGSAAATPAAASPTQANAGLTSSPPTTSSPTSAPASESVAPTPVATESVAPTPTASQSVTVGEGEAWVAFQSLADQFNPAADRDGIDHDDTIFLVRTDGTGLHRLPPGDFVGSEIRPTWSPDGKRIAFLRGHLANDVTELWAINADGSDAELLYRCEDPLSPSGCNTIDYPDWAPDGKTIYFQRDSNLPPEPGPPLTFEIWRYDLATRDAGPVLTREDGMSVDRARISPDGTQAVYVRGSEATPNSALFIAGLSAGRERQLTDNQSPASYPDWCNNEIAFNTYDLRYFPDTAEAANLYTIATDGTNLQQLTHYSRNDTRATQPRWASDCSGIVFTLVSRVASDAYGVRHLAYIDADGTNQRLLTPQPIIGTHPELRPLPDQ